ncbi:nucleolin [Hirschfeldia incana]|nr:nucleolin [Hirschfeldia incana]
MSHTTEENECFESEIKRSWIWSKAVSVGKKVLTAGVVVSSAPLLFPPLVVASTIAFISSVPFCLFLANYACTQKVMRTLLPPNEETSGTKKDEYSFEEEDVKRGHGGAGMAGFYRAEPVLIQSEEDEEMAKESKGMIEKIRDEGRAEQDGEKSGNDKSEKVQDQTGKQEATKTGHEGELESTTTEASTGKDEETSANEPVDQAVSAPSGTGEDKRKNTSKKKKKTGRAGLQ